MTMTPFFRKLNLTAHISFSVGWFGAVAGFLALAIAGLISENTLMVRSSYLGMELIGWLVIVPACLLSLLTGLIQSLGTQWGLFRHYWIVVKFILTTVSTIILFLHMQPISYLADIAYRSEISSSELRGLRIQLIADAGAALLVLLITTTISVYKPWGRTPYGLRVQYKQNKRMPTGELRTKKKWGLYVLLVLIAVVIVLFIILHITGVLRGH